jgi:hypothetical protein
VQISHMQHMHMHMHIMQNAYAHMHMHMTIQFQFLGCSVLPACSNSTRLPTQFTRSSSSCIPQQLFPVLSSLASQCNVQDRDVLLNSPVSHIRRCTEGQCTE